MIEDWHILFCIFMGTKWRNLRCQIKNKRAMSEFFKVWSIYRTHVSKRSGANKRSRLMKDLSERLEESEEDGDGWNSQEDKVASIRALLPPLAQWKLQMSGVFLPREQGCGKSEKVEGPSTESPRHLELSRGQKWLRLQIVHPSSFLSPSDECFIARYDCSLR